MESGRETKKRGWGRETATLAVTIVALAAALTGTFSALDATTSFLVLFFGGTVMHAPRLTLS